MFPGQGTHLILKNNLAQRRQDAKGKTFFIRLEFQAEQKPLGPTRGFLL